MGSEDIGVIGSWSAWSSSSRGRHPAEKAMPSSATYEDGLHRLFRRRCRTCLTQLFLCLFKADTIKKQGRHDICQRDHVQESVEALALLGKRASTRS
jgi:hypothetical protein